MRRFTLWLSPTAQQHGAAASAHQRPPWRAAARAFAAFWLLGVLNNCAYVIMLAGANDIAASAVGLVYFAAIAPTILVKASAPYWFHLVRYSVRFAAAAALMAAAFCIVALSSSTGLQLAGVALVALQGGLGEASALALCSLAPDSQLSLTAWSSGTGFAGIAGYAWVAVLHLWLRLSFRATLLTANVLPLLWLAVFWEVLARHTASARPGSGSQQLASYASLRLEPAAGEEEAVVLVRSPGSERQGGSRRSSRSKPSWPGSALLSPREPGAALELTTSADLDGPAQAAQQAEGEQLLPQRSVLSSSSTGRASRSPPGKPPSPARSDQQGRGDSPEPPAPLPPQQQQQQRQQQPGGGSAALDPRSMSLAQRLRATAALWPFMVPLFVVYFAEYAMQAGTWTAIGFPVTSAESRHAFYILSNWLYQGGVFISRSSGMLYQANRAVLWAMPAAQAGLLGFFVAMALTHAWWNWGLAALCFVAGLLGGAVYVNAFTLLSKDVAPQLREFSLAAACVADSLGIAAADLAGVLIQGCLFRWQALPGAAFKCGGAA